MECKTCNVETGHFILGSQVIKADVRWNDKQKQMLMLNVMMKIAEQIKRILLLVTHGIFFSRENTLR